MFVGYKYKGKILEATKVQLTKDRIFEICYYKQDEFIQVADNSAMYLHPYRAYFRHDGRFENDGKTFTIEIIDDYEEDITGIKEVNVISNNKVYTVNGTQVNEMKKGQLYIINGKKIIY